MLYINYLEPRMLIADEGYLLTNGESYGSVIYLGKNESIKSWDEVSEEEIKRKEEQANEQETMA